MKPIWIAGFASVGFAVLVDTALAGAPAVFLVLLQGLVCLRSSLSAVHIG